MPPPSLPSEPKDEFEALLAQIQWLIAHPEHPDREIQLYRAIDKFIFFRDAMTDDPEKVQTLIELTHQVREAVGPGHLIADKRMMEHLTCLAGDGQYILEQAMRPKRPLKSKARFSPPEQQRTCQVLRSLCEYALDCLRFRQPHDSFSGRRKVAAFEILTYVSRIFDIPDAVTLARQALRQGRRHEASGAAEFLAEYYKHRKIQPEKEVVDELMALVDRTDTRTVAATALNVLVDTGVFSDLAALARMDTWKEKHPYW